MKEILVAHGLILHGNCVINDFTFERPFVLWGGVSVQNVVGGGV